MAKKRIPQVIQTGSDADFVSANFLLIDGINRSSTKIPMNLVGKASDIAGLDESKYEKPADGIPETDLSESVQQSIARAGTSIQGVQANGSDLPIDENGKVNVTKASLGLENVDNTSDMEKPVSTAQQTALRAELNARETADTALGSRIDTEATAGETADTALGNRIDTEATARTSADTALGNRIDTEATARETADTALGNRIDTESTDRETADAALGSRIDAEITARETADTELGELIGTEASTRSSEVSDLDRRITGEVTARTSADTALGDRIDTEAASREIAVSAVAADLASETTRAVGAEVTQVSLETQNNTKFIVFKNRNGAEKFKLDATDFIKDGMVDTVEIKTVQSVECLVITFNTDAGKDTINIPLTEIFNPDEYQRKLTRGSNITIDSNNVISADFPTLATVATTGEYSDLAHTPDLTQYKTKQNAQANSGSTLKTATAINQDSNGEMTVTFDNIQSATTSQKGVVQLAGSIGATVSTENNKAASEKAVRDAINSLVIPGSSIQVQWSQTPTDVDTLLLTPSNYSITADSSVLGFYVPEIPQGLSEPMLGAFNNRPSWIDGSPIVAGDYVTLTEIADNKVEIGVDTGVQYGLATSSRLNAIHQQLSSEITAARMNAASNLLQTGVTVGEGILDYYDPDSAHPGEDIPGEKLLGRMDYIKLCEIEYLDSTVSYTEIVTHFHVVGKFSSWHNSNDAAFIADVYAGISVGVAGVLWTVNCGGKVLHSASNQSADMTIEIYQSEYNPNLIGVLLHCPNANNNYSRIHVEGNTAVVKGDAAVVAIDRTVGIDTSLTWPAWNYVDTRSGHGRTLLKSVALAY